MPDSNVIANDIRSYLSKFVEVKEIEDFDLDSKVDFLTKYIEDIYPELWEKGDESVNAYSKIILNIPGFIEGKNKIYEKIRSTCPENFIDNKKEQLEDLDRAMMFSYIAHARQERKDRNPYFVHPFSSLENLIDSGLFSINSWKAMLLHDVIEDCPNELGMTEEALGNIIDSNFGKDVLGLVKGVTKIKSSNAEQKQALAIKTVIDAISNDPRILYMKIADRINNLETISSKSQDSKIKIAKETIDIYCPLARLFGLRDAEEKMTNLSLKILDKIKFNEMNQLLSLENIITAEEYQKIKDLILPKIKKFSPEITIEASSVGRYLRKNGDESKSLYDNFTECDGKTLGKSPFIIIIEIDDNYDLSEVMSKLDNFIIGIPIDSRNVRNNYSCFTGVVAKSRKVLDVIRGKNNNLVGNMVIPIKVVYKKDRFNNSRGILARAGTDNQYKSPIDFKNAWEGFLSINKGNTYKAIKEFIRAQIPENVHRVSGGGKHGTDMLIPKEYKLSDYACEVHTDFLIKFLNAVIIRGNERFTVENLNFPILENDNIFLHKGEELSRESILNNLMSLSHNKTIAKMRQFLKSSILKEGKEIIGETILKPDVYKDHLSKYKNLFSKYSLDDIKEEDQIYILFGLKLMKFK